MTPPTITHLQFAALSVLQDGRHLGGTSIARAMMFHNPGSFTIIIRPLAARGLIERVGWTGAVACRGGREREGRRIGYPAAASPQFAILFRALREGELKLADLIALSVADVDLVAGTCRVASVRKRLHFGPRLCSIFAEAIGTRRAGPVFANGVGGAWRRCSVTNAFSDARRRAGVPLECKLSGRLGNKHGRPSSHRSIAGRAG
jgi:hypothetical protein